jgi:hypothetical protein
MYTLTRNLVALSLLAVTIVHAREIIDKAGSTENNPWVFNVLQAFEHIPVRTKVSLNIWTDGLIEPPRYAQTLANRSQGIWGGLNHFQSIKRLPAHLGLGNLVAIAGTDPHTPESQLFIAQIASQPNNELFTKNKVKRHLAPHDKLIKKIGLSEEYWYAGSMDMAGSYLAIPIQKNDASQVLFYQVGYQGTDKKSPENLKVEDLHIAIRRTNTDAQAVALTRLADGYYLLAVWTNGIAGNNKGLDFYCSKDTDITHGFDPQGMIHIPTSLFNNYKRHNNYKNINFINDYNGNLYLIALEKAPSKLPLSSDEDIADLFEIKVRTITEDTVNEAKLYDPKGITAQLRAGMKRPYVLYIQGKHMYCKEGACNFNSGATAYIPDQQHIFIYSLPYWLVERGKQLTFAQYGSIQRTYPTCTKTF